MGILQMALSLFLGSGLVCSDITFADAFSAFKPLVTKQLRPIPRTSSFLHATKHTLSHAEISRYSRHLVLQDVGIAGQQALKDAAVLVIGAGGLGSPCLLYLAAAGVGHIGIVDGDTVDESNLQRQIIHGTSTVGVSKCQSAASRINDINPNVRVKLYEKEFTSETAAELVQKGFDENTPWDVIVDGSDNFPTKYLINDVCSMFSVPWVYSAILAFEGQLSVFNYGPNGPDYRDLLPTPPPPGDVPSCAEGGVLGVLPGTMGCLQATEVIKVILYGTGSKSTRPINKSKVDILSGRVLVFDALRMKFNEIGLQRDADRDPITSLIDYQGFCGAPVSTPAQQSEIPVGTRTMDEDEDATVSSASVTFNSIDPKFCYERLVQDGWSPFVLDVRLQTEHDIVALPFTDKVVPHRTVNAKHDVPSAGDILVYCKAGVRGKKACQKLVEQGVEPTRLYNLDGGIMKWQKDVDPAMPRY